MGEDLEMQENENWEEGNDEEKGNKVMQENKKQREKRGSRGINNMIQPVSINDVKKVTEEEELVHQAEMEYMKEDKNDSSLREGDEGYQGVRRNSDGFNSNGDELDTQKHKD